MGLVNGGKFERSIQEWYQNSRTVDLEFLNLENTKPELPGVCNNIAVIYDKLLLHSKISIKQFYQTQEAFSQQTEAIDTRLRKVEQTQIEILRSVETLENEILAKRPLTYEEINRLIYETTNPPKEQEQEVLRVTTKIEDQQRQLLSLVSELKQAVIG